MYTLTLPALNGTIPVTLHPDSAMVDFGSDGKHIALCFDLAPELLAHELGYLQWRKNGDGRLPEHARILRGGILFSRDTHNEPPSIGSLIFVPVQRFDMVGQLG